MNVEALNVDNMNGIKQADVNQIKQFLSAFDYEQLEFIERLLNEIKKGKFADYMDKQKEAYKYNRQKRLEREAKKETDFYPLVRRFCKERLNAGDIVRFKGSNDWREVVEVLDDSVLGLQVYFRQGNPVRTGYSSENGFDKLEGMKRKGIFVPIKELITEL